MQGANKKQLRLTLQCVVEDLEMKTSVMQENRRLRSELRFLKSKKGNSKLLLEETCNLKEKLKTRQEVLGLWKKGKEYLLEIEKQIDQKTKERDFLSKQLLYKNECSLLKKTNRDLEAALSKREEETHVLELEGKNKQKKAGKLQEKNDSLQEEKNTLQEEKNQLQKQMSQLQLKLNDLVFETNSLKVKLSEARRLELDQKQNAHTLEMECCKLDEQLEQKTLEVKYPDECFKYCQEPPRHERKPGLLNLELKGRLNAKCRQLEKMNLVLKEKEKQIGWKASMLQEASSHHH
ncbi:calcium-binding and coiled-coil domain-containing protein 2-like [Cyclopterus lumpus]|uniref:calcium-binding and coiled-coil domain-containing protein 2-like n=1 Tax=Cyclopterus lumpus TaxID=8103 RepID=UPI001486CE07|nr:calcium-binding and coiled-coil domain-containing protein 2-like [Cyclopterus lumpus]